MAKQQKLDDEDSLKRRARRRLIGAVALVTVVVLVLPMVLDKEPRTVDQNIELRIPDKNSVGEFNPKMEPAPASAPAASTQPDAAAQPAPNAVAPPPAEAAKPEKNQVHTEAAQPETPKPAATSATEKAAAKPHAAAAKPAGEVAHAEAKSGFVVQLGAYSNAETAHDLLKKLSQKGIKAYAEKDGSLTRLRVGPFKTREEAAKVQSRIEAQGLKAIVAPAI